MGNQDKDIFGRYIHNNRYELISQLTGAKPFIGNNVFNQIDEDLGYIKEVLLDPNTGEVRYALLSYSDFLGLGEKLFAVPWQALTLDTKNKRFLLNMDSRKLATSTDLND